MVVGEGAGGSVGGDGGHLDGGHCALGGGAVAGVVVQVGGAVAGTDGVDQDAVRTQVPGVLDGFPHWPGTSAEQANGPEVRDGGQLMQLVALGQVVAVVPESVRRHARSDVVCVPVLDAPRSSVLLAWPERTRSRAVAAFVRASTEVAASGQVMETVAASVDCR
jgi:hypothetical protein